MGADVPSQRRLSVLTEGWSAGPDSHRRLSGLVRVGELLRQRWNRRLDLLGKDPFGDPHRPSEARIELATYPEAVVLTGLFSAPYWRDHPQLPAEAAHRLGIAPQQLHSAAALVRARSPRP